MNKLEITLKDSPPRPKKHGYNLNKIFFDDEYEDLSSDIYSSEVFIPNPIRKSCALECIRLVNTPSSLCPSSPSTPFGPKTKACIIPCKDLGDQVRNIDLDQLDNYNIWSDIGKGSYAVVKLATHKETLKKCAIKIYTNKSLEEPALKENVMREINILQKIEHKNIVEFYEEINGENNLYLVMEYVKGIGLNNYLVGKTNRRLQEREACIIFQQVISALNYCHGLGITHRDIKLENIQLDLDLNVKLIDFGFATCTPRNVKSLIYCGSPSYMAPEIIQKVEFYGPPVDIWASGIVLFLLVTGDFPFKSNVEKKVFNKVKKGFFSIPEFVSPICADLIKRILQTDPERRITAGEILDHTWIKTCGGSGVYATPSFGDNIEVDDE